VVQLNIQTRQETTLSASASGNYSFSVPSSRACLTVFINTNTTPTPVAVSTGSLPDATAGTSYSVNLSATGGTAPYTWRISAGNLPEGITLTGATLSGTPSSAGQATFTVEVKDAQNETATKSLSITVKEQGTEPLQITTVSGDLATGEKGVAYSDDLEATGGSAPYTWTATGLPNGLAINGTQIEGTPTEAGTFTISVTVTDGAGTHATKNLQLTISDNATILSGNNRFLPGVNTGGEIMVTDCRGRIVIASAQDLNHTLARNRIISGQSSGLYVVRFVRDGRYVASRMLINGPQ
jgi:hypothetical protein